LPSSLGRFADLALFAPIGLVCRLRDEVPHLAEAGRARVEGRLRIARLIGELAVKQGRREVVRRLDEVAAQRRLSSAPLIAEALLHEEATVGAPLVEIAAVERPVLEQQVVEPPAAKTQATKQPAAKKSAAEKRAARKSVAKKSAAKKSAAKRPGVDEPAAQQQTAGATQTTAPAASPVDAALLPISDYDSLAASQVVARLEALGPDDLTAIGTYEAATRGRRTILGKVQQLQAG
jgi:hypothetical protein